MEKAALDHDLVNVDGKDATCTEPGYTAYKDCSRCDYIEGKEVIDALDHNEVTDEAVSPSCTETGLTEGSHCSVCGETLVKQNVVSAVGHKAGGVVVENKVDATCTADGSYDNVTYCVLCEIELSRETITVDALDHDYKPTVTPPTCTEKGYTTHICSRCSDSYVDTYVDATGHSYDATVTAPTCNKNGYTTYTCACGDSYKADYVELTYHNFVNGTCSICQATKAGYLIAPNVINSNLTGHGQWAVARLFGIGAAEYLGYSGLGYAVDQNNVVPTLPAILPVSRDVHTLQYYAWICLKNDDCRVESERGIFGYSVDGGKPVYSNDFFDTASGNGYHNQGVQNAGLLGDGKSAPTCDIRVPVGTLSVGHHHIETYYMTSDGDVIILDVLDINIEDPSLETIVLANKTGDLHNVVGATLYGMRFNVGDKLLKQLVITAVATFEDLPSFNQNAWTVKVYQWNTDYGTTQGSTPLYTVSGSNHVNGRDFYLDIPDGVTITGDILVELYYDSGTSGAFTGWAGSNPVPGYQSFLHGMTDLNGTPVAPMAASIKVACNHSYNSGVVTAPTCTAQGYTTYTCTKCGSSYTADYTEATGHSYSSAVTAPTCTVDGYTTYTCGTCGYNYTDNVVPATGHTFADATCTAPKTCACGATEGEVLDHSYESVVTKPTCTADGYTTHTCGVCGHAYTDSEVPAPGHTPGDDATCEEAQTCIVCGVVINEAGGHIPGPVATCTTAQTCKTCGETLVDKLGHNYESVVTAPTCQAQGYTTHTCTRCGDSYTDSTTAIVDCRYNAVVTDPTCTTYGYTTYICEYGCGSTYVSAPTAALGHNYDTVVTDYTCTTAGSIVYTCSNCGDTYTQVLPAAHDYKGVVTLPTCKADGYTTYTCSACSASYKGDYTAMTDHTYTNGVCSCGATYKWYHDGFSVLAGALPNQPLLIGGGTYVGTHANPVGYSAGKRVYQLVDTDPSGHWFWINGWVAWTDDTVGQLGYSIDGGSINYGNVLAGGAGVINPNSDLLAILHGAEWNLTTAQGAGFFDMPVWTYGLSGAHTITVCYKDAAGNVAIVDEFVVELPVANSEQIVLAQPTNPNEVGWQNNVGAKLLGLRFNVGEKRLDKVVLNAVATYTQDPHTFVVRVYQWNTDYVTTQGGTVLYEMYGANHINATAFYIHIPVDVVITGEVLVEIEYLSGAWTLTSAIGTDPIDGYTAYLHGDPQYGPMAAYISVSPLPETPDEPETEPDTTPDVEPEGPSISINYPAAALPEYEQYTTVSRIEQVLANNTFAFAVNGQYYYVNGKLYEGGNGIMTGANAMDSSKLNALLGTGASGSTPAAVAASLGMNSVIYDDKVVLFYVGDAPLSTYEDLYTFEAMYLYMTAADETEIQNAFIDLPDRISNNASNTVFYTAPDLNLGVQTSVYFAQMGQANGLTVGPALVAGEGKYSENFTTVRIFNNQQTVVTQFLAFDASVKGGVQVAAAQVNGETLIATAAFADHPGTNGDVRVFDAFGLLRMTISVKGLIDGPYTIATGHFAEGMKNEVLLIASQNTDANGRLRYVLVSLATGKVISMHTLDCSFAGKNTPVAISVRNNGSAGDTVILYFNSVQKVYEGNAQKAQFANAGLTLPPEAVAVTASNVTGQKYSVAVSAGYGDKNGNTNTSYLAVYDASATVTNQDVGFRENRFFYASSTEGVVSGIGGTNNDDRYVSEALFAHERTDDLNNNMMNLLSAVNGKDDAAIDKVFDTAKYSDYANTVAANYAAALKIQNVFLEPCFTHRWHKVNSGISANYPATINAMNALAGYGNNTYLTVDKDGNHVGYDEGDDVQFYTGTYADGILDLAKLRIYPLRSFLQTTAVGFRGTGSNPEHLVGVSPVHEQEITTAMNNKTLTSSAGDYNPKMIEGFRNYLLDAYGSADGVNATFGTNFASDDKITAPKEYSNNAFFQEWVLYNRYIVSKRIMEAYREALLAGYPPESISAHSIPDAAVSNTTLSTKPNNSNFRITPLDVILSCGTAYGGTRYGNTDTTNNLVTDAHKMGHSNITLGEFSSNQGNQWNIGQDNYNTNAYNYLKSYWDNGLRFAHIICTASHYRAAEIYAFKKLYTDNQPRPGYTGGTTGAVSVSNQGKQYTIVQIGNSSKTGLLKSIDTAGKWEGTVYLVPFHTKVNTTVIEMKKNANVYTTGALSYIKNSDQVELTFNAAKVGAGRAWVEIEVYNNGCLMEKSVTTYELTETMSSYRYVLSNQLYDSGLEVKVTFKTESGEPMDSIIVENMYATFQTEVASFTYFNGVQQYSSSQAHQGGVTFDLLDRNMVG